jgi:hypothetical protein
MKSTDGGKTWTPAWPTSFTQAMGALARGQDGTLWAGTGEANPSGGGDTFLGNGIYKSTDGGRSWRLSGLPDSGAFGRIAVNPDNPKEVWAAASGWLSPISSQRGLYHTTDGGKTWKLALAPPNATTGAIDVAVDPAHPNIILASLWDRHRNNGAFFYGGAGSGLYRSIDDGETWTRLKNSNITGKVCSWDETHSGLNVNSDLGRIGIAFAPSKPDRVYIQSSGAEGPDKGFYVSNNAGQTWTCGAGEPGAPGAGYEWVFGRLWVDPVNANHIFAADVTLRESNNGGATWHDSDGMHVDQHAMAWDPHVALEPVLPPVGVAAGPQAAGHRHAGPGQQPHLDGRRRAHQPDTVESVLRRRRPLGADQPGQRTRVLRVLPALTADRGLREVRRLGQDRPGHHEDDELLPAELARRDPDHHRHTSGP